MSERLGLGTVDAPHRVARLYLDLLEDRARRRAEGRDAERVERALAAVVNFKVNSAVRQG